jgi:hypothetical protein
MSSLLQALNEDRYFLFVEIAMDSPGSNGWKNIQLHYFLNLERRR